MSNVAIFMAICCWGGHKYQIPVNNDNTIFFTTRALFSLTKQQTGSKKNIIRIIRKP